MTGSLASGVWLLIMLTGVNYSYPTNKDNLNAKPHRSTSDEAPSSDELDFSSEPEPPEFESVSPLIPFLSEPQPGGMSYVEKVYEHGTYNSESEGKGPSLRHVEALNRFHGRGPLTVVQPVGGVWFGYPRYFLLLPQAPGLRGLSSCLVG
ncbi:hypothetical protein CRENBAI_021390 [Crenichthys baileyi]|uniref:Uncharacterized protein n=1 Tax=Crenichthys baileyi TaxID=28760 RepID=A0AAV9SHB1_9TELE